MFEEAHHNFSMPQLSGPMEHGVSLLVQQVLVLDVLAFLLENRDDLFLVVRVDGVPELGELAAVLDCFLHPVEIFHVGVF